MQHFTLKILTILLLASYFTASSEVYYQGNNLALTISNIRNDKGQILISVFNQPEGFPSDSTKAYRTFQIEAQAPSVSIIIEGMNPGDYAIAVVHDENCNLKLDYNLVGAPVEGYAASVANKRFSAPKFASSKFTIENDLNLEIEMNYLF
ncbi:MAG: DUF2141 domain-containing protein [Bacteroidales bacterium]|nr:DUF2141 domain-containing protein [Bacteroidales bacterium]